MVDRSIHVTVVFALPGRTWREEVSLAAGQTVGDAVDASGLDAICYSETGQLPAGYGVFGRNVRTTDALIDGQRIEIYRPLTVDPRSRRRQRERG